MMIKMTGESKNILEQNIADLRQLFPEVCCEDKIDFDKLKQILGEYVDDNKERYNFTWNGKGQAIKLSQTPSMGTLRPYPGEEESKDWNATENLYIEGDNLEVLKLLQKSYYGKVKMIYIDPPYNTKEDFIYQDDFSDSLTNYRILTGQMNQGGEKLSNNAESTGRYHTRWLNMIYPRLKIARTLLADEGVILINIDEHEIANLQNICTEILGEYNELGIIVWDKRNPKGDAKGISYQHEYILVYSKNKDKLLDSQKISRPKKNASMMIKKAEQLFKKMDESYTIEDVNSDFSSWIAKQTELSGGERAYNKIDENGNVYRAVSMAWPNKKKAPEDYFIPLIHPNTGKLCPVPERGWRNPSATMKKMMDDGKILFGKDETTIPNSKYLLAENMYENIPSLIYYGGSDTEVLNRMNIPFDTPKSINICKEHIRAFTNESDIVLDFFSGSATTAHAVMQLNAEDGGNRRFIMVQLPEPCAEKTEAYKAGYQNICEIGKERIRRAGEKIKQEIEAENAQLKTGEDQKKVPDIGFKVFKLDSSNLKKWQPDYDDFNQSLLDSIDNYVEGRTELDVVYEIMLKMGLELTYPLETCMVKDKNIYVIAYGALMICLDHEITTDVAHEMIRLHEEYQPEIWQVVFKDNGFASDSVKTNIKEMLKVAGLDEDAFTTI